MDLCVRAPTLITFNRHKNYVTVVINYCQRTQAMTSKRRSWNLVPEQKDCRRKLSSVLFRYYCRWKLRSFQLVDSLIWDRAAKCGPHCKPKRAAPQLCQKRKVENQGNQKRRLKRGETLSSFVGIELNWFKQLFSCFFRFRLFKGFYKFLVHCWWTTEPNQVFCKLEEVYARFKFKFYVRKKDTHFSVKSWRFN